MARNPEATEALVNKIMDTAKVTAVTVKNKEAMIMITDTAKVMEDMVRNTAATVKITEVMAKAMEDMVKTMATVTAMVTLQRLVMATVTKAKVTKVKVTVLAKITAKNTVPNLKKTMKPEVIMNKITKPEVNTSQNYPMDPRKVTVTKITITAGTKINTNTTMVVTVTDLITAITVTAMVTGLHTTTIINSRFFSHFMCFH